MLVGTPAYLSPEQVAGEGGDHRADIYALGIVAYEMLTGEPPFTGPTPTMVLMRRLAEPPPPLEKRRPDAPPLLRDVINGMLAADPALRFQSAGDVVRTWLARRRSPEAMPPPRSFSAASERGGCGVWSCSPPR